MNAASASWECFAAPVSSDVPVGRDPAYDPDFLRLGKEMERSRSIQGAATDWALVEAESARLLRDHAKDVRAASWLVVAMANISGWNGAAEGLAGYAVFVERFWNAAHPQRARARVGFVAWLWEGLVRALDERSVTSEDRAVLRHVEALVSPLDAALGELLGDANPGATAFRRLVRDRIASLPEEEPVAPPPVMPPSPPVDESPAIEEEAASRPSELDDAVESDAASTASLPADSAEDQTPADAEDPTVSEEPVALAFDDDEASLEDLVSRALGLPSRRERFLATLKVATIARQRADADVALALCERLLPEVDPTLEAWEPSVCTDFFEEYLDTLDVAGDDRERERGALRSHLFRRLLALNPALAFRTRASREGT